MSEAVRRYRSMSVNDVGNISLNKGVILQYNKHGYESINDTYSCEAMTRNELFLVTNSCGSKW